MLDNKYAKAYTEVLEIIKYFPEEEYNKIPKEKIEFYKNNKDKDYKFIIDPRIDLSRQNVSKEASAIIVTIFKDYFASEEQKKKLEGIIELNEKKSEIIKREKFNPDDLFKSKNSSKIVNESNQNNIEVTALTEYKENFFTKVKNFILQVLHLKN